MAEPASPRQFATKGKVKRDLFLGRFQPFHNGHAAIVKSMKSNPVVVIVKGSKSSTDKDKNPFNEEYQMEMISAVFPNLEVSISPNGFLPGILGFFRKKGEEITRIYCGKDRIEGYKKAIDNANTKMDDQYRYDVEFIETPRIARATEVRDAIKKNDEALFKKLVPRQLWGEFDKMKQIILDESKLLSFEEWLIENNYYL